MPGRTWRNKLEYSSGGNRKHCSCFGDGVCQHHQGRDSSHSRTLSPAAASGVLCGDSYSKEKRIPAFVAEKNFRSSRYGAEFQKRFHCRFKPKVTRQTVSIGWDAPRGDGGRCKRLTIVFEIAICRILVTSEVTSQRVLQDPT